MKTQAFLIELTTTWNAENAFAGPTSFEIFLATPSSHHTTYTPNVELMLNTCPVKPVNHQRVKYSEI
jgi:hypothetical protein